MDTVAKRQDQLQPTTKPGVELRLHALGLKNKKKELKEIIMHLEGVLSAIEKIDRL